MIKEILELILGKMEERDNRNTDVNDTILELVGHIDKLEVEYAKKMEYVDRWGDINDPSDYRTAEANKVKRMIEAKQRLIETLEKRL